MKLKDLLPMLHGFVDIYDLTDFGEKNKLCGKYDCYSLTAENCMISKLLDAKVEYIAPGEKGKGIMVAVNFNGGDDE